MNGETEPKEAEEGFLQKNGKKFILAIVGAVCVTYLAATGEIDPMVAVIYLFTIGGVGAGAITK